MAVQEVAVPDIGGAEGAEVIELLVATGDQVVLDQGLIVLESDKASMEIPSTVAGTVVELLIAVGDQLAEGAAVARIEVDAAVNADAVASVSAAMDAAPPSEDAAPPSEDAAPPSEDAAPPSEDVAPAAQKPPAVDLQPASSAPAPASATGAPAAIATTLPVGKHDTSHSYAGPAVRKLAREFGVQLVQVVGSGPQGRILKEDVQQFVQQALDTPAAAGAAIPVVPAIDYSQFGAIETTPRSKLEKLTAANMHRSWLNVPHVTQFDEADITDLEAFRAGLKPAAEARATRLTPLPFLLKACAVALRDNPRLNCSLTQGGDAIVHKGYMHIGMAVDTPAGLMVPVVRDVDQKSIWQLAVEVQDLAARARERKLTPKEMQGGCFTVSSLGNIGGSGFTPIVNTPEVGILGVSKATTKPVWDGAAFVPRTMLPLALSYDHRAVNGGDGGRFLTRLVALLSDIRHLSL